MCFTGKKAAAGLFLLLGFYLISPIPADPLQGGFSDPPRSLDEIFPGLDDSQKLGVFSGEGFQRSFERQGTQCLIPGPNSGIDLFSVVMEKNPSHFVEALMVVPYNGKPIGIQDAYNALGRIGDIKNHSYFSRGRNMNIYIFEESTRIEGVKSGKPVPDPLFMNTYPVSEEIFLMLKDKYFGNIYVRGDLSINRYGVTFNVTNFKTIRYFLFPVMRAEKFSAILYIEPLKEGLLIYGMAAVDIPNFIASRINIAASVERRLHIFIEWFKEGLRK